MDDAAIFPPGNLELPDALSEHRRHDATWYAGVLGPLVCDDRRLPALTRLLDAGPASDDGPLALSLVVTGGAGALGPALTWAQRHKRLSLRAVEIALRDEDDLARNAERMATVLSLELEADAVAHIEMPRLTESDPTHGWLAAADVVAEAGHRLKFRTGGDTPAAHPDEAELAKVIAAALDRELAFKCTAGLHHAIRRTDPATGFEQHGFVNVMVATRALLDGAGIDDVVRVLADRDGAALAWAVSGADPTSIRRWFTSIGSCSIDEPVTDLVELGLLTASHASTGASVEHPVDVP